MFASYFIVPNLAVWDIVRKRESNRIKAMILKKGLRYMQHTNIGNWGIIHAEPVCFVVFLLQNKIAFKSSIDRHFYGLMNGFFWFALLQLKIEEIYITQLLFMYLGEGEFWKLFWMMGGANSLAEDLPGWDWSRRKVSTENNYVAWSRKPRTLPLSFQCLFQKLRTAEKPQLQNSYMYPVIYNSMPQFFTNSRTFL